MSDNTEMVARAEAGHAALRLIHKYGLKTAGAILRGYFHGFTRALVAVDGGVAVRQQFESIMGSTVPRGTKPKLAVDNAPEHHDHLPGAA